MRRTKIIATIGPVSDTEQQIEALIRAGVGVFRFNMKHATREWHDERIVRVKQISQRINIPVQILIDLQGPEIRVETHNKQEVAFKKDELVKFSQHEIGERDIVIPDEVIYRSVKIGDIVLIDDGSIELKIESVAGDSFIARLTRDYTIKHRKSLNLPNVDIDLPSMTIDDYQKLDMSNIKDVDIVALSFTRSKNDVDILRSELQKRGLGSRICAKIENQMALDHLDEIIDSSDIVMVARGDLGVETPLEKLAFNQKNIIKHCYEKQKAVIVATQMMHSMVNNPRPTRAEAVDVSNAVFDGASATMLSEETAGGQYPLETVIMMEKIISFTETVVPSSASFPEL